MKKGGTLFYKKRFYYMKNKSENDKEIPLGFGMALCLDTMAMKKFSDMSESERGIILSKARNINTKDEMTRLIKSITE